MVRNTRALAGRSIELPHRFAQTVVIDPSPAEAELYAGVVKHVRAAAAGATPGAPAKTVSTAATVAPAVTSPAGRLALRNLLERAGSSAAAVRDTLANAQEAGSLREDVLRELMDLAAAAEGASRKTRKLVELLQALPSLAPSSKAVVFTRFRATLAALEQALTAAAIPHEVFRGGQSGAEKDEAVRRLKEEVSVMLATEVGGEGRNLQFANVLINFDLPWNPMAIEQRIGRLHRIGQTREVHVFSLCARHTAEERILEVLDKRIHLFELVIGEVDLILGRALDEKEFDERIFDIYATAAGEEQVTDGFEALARDLEAARGHHERVRALDDALFGRDYET